MPELNNVMELYKKMTQKEYIVVDNSTVCSTGIIANSDQTLPSHRRIGKVIQQISNVVNKLFHIMFNPNKMRQNISKIAKSW